MSSVAAQANAAGKQDGGNPYRVMLVDDSAVIRGLFKRWLEEDSSVSVVASVSNGEQALRNAANSEAEIIVLDIEMPGMDGMTALPKLLEIRPDVKIIMASTLTTRNADISMTALSKGAADYIPKPTSTRELHAAQGFRVDLVHKVKALGSALRKANKQDLPSPAAAEESKTNETARVIVADEKGPRVSRVSVDRNRPIELRKGSTQKPEILAIGSSTGGPQALFSVFGFLKDTIKVPVVITQHMPPTFTSILAEHINRIGGVQAKEATDGEVLEAGKVYIAPGDYHMKLARQKGETVLRLNQDPPENFCRPAVDPMLRSISAIYGDRALAVILTGMGQDGYLGSDLLVKSGGTVIAQDEKTSVVWGMPGAVASGGLCSAVLPLDDIGPAIQKALAGGGV